MNDELKPIPGWPNYSITRDGRIWSDFKYRRFGDGWVSPFWHEVSHKKYLCIFLCRNGKQKCRYVHLLVLEAWVGPRPPGTEGCHKDDNPANNHVDNLYWGTPAQNREDARRNGRVPWCKLTEQDVWDIHVLYHEDGLTRKQIARQIRIHWSMVGHILRGKYWPDVFKRYHQP